MTRKTDRTAGRSLAEGVTERLNQLGMSRRELARRAGLSRQTIHNIEHEGNTHLKPSTFMALDTALHWEPGTSLSLALGVGNPEVIEGKVIDYLGRIAFHLSHMSTAELELTLVMLEENELGHPNHTTEEFTLKVGQMVENCLREISHLKEDDPHKHAS